MTVRLPRLMDANLSEITRLHPSGLSATLSLTPLSISSMSLPDGEPSVSVRQFVEVYGLDGSLGIYRISSVSNGYGQEQRVSLEHGIVTLQDAITPADTEWTGGMSGILQSILACQTQVFWQLGTVEAEGDHTFAVNQGDALQALLDASSLAEDCMLVFDQTTSPWTIHLTKRPSAVSSECRMSRNMDGVTIGIDSADLCTRAVSEYLPGGSMDADTVSAWGVVAKYITLDEEATDAENQAEALRYLNEHKQPSVSIDVDAVMLAQLTGESLDSFALGQQCRVALPDWNTVMTETIVTMAYPDLLNTPEQVRLTMATAEKNAASSMAAMRRDVNSNTRSLGHVHRHITETNNELKLHAQRITANAEQINLKASAADVSLLSGRVNSAEIALDGAKAQINLVAQVQDENEQRLSAAEILLDGQAATIRLNAEKLDAQGNRLSAAEVAIDGANAQIALKASKTDVDALGSRVSSAEVAIDGANAQIGLVAQTANANGQRLSAAEVRLDGQEATIALNAEKLNEQGQRLSSAEIAIDGAAAEIALKVDKGGVVSAINMSSESIKISSSKIQLDGQTIAGYLSGTSIDVNELDADEIWAGSSIHLSGDTVSASSLYASDDISTDGSLTCATATIAGCNIAAMQAQEITVLTTVGVAMSYATAATPSGGSVEVVRDVSVSRQYKTITFYTE